MSRTIRVDPDVYAALLLVKNRLSNISGRPVSFGRACAFVVALWDLY